MCLLDPKHKIIAEAEGQWGWVRGLSRERPFSQSLRRLGGSFGPGPERAMLPERQSLGPYVALIK